MVCVEVVCCSPEDCQVAEAVGANRIELCGAIMAGGLTPSIGLFEECRASTNLPIIVMIRPREGGLFYSDLEFSQMVRDLDAFRDREAFGFVTGILNRGGSIDESRMTSLRSRAPELEAMCHRAFDVTPDPFLAIDALVRAGFQRVLSSGQQRDIRLGFDLLQQLIRHANGRIEIQPCEHIRPDNLVEVLEFKPASIHLGPFLDAVDPTSDLGRLVTYGGHKVLDGETVREVVRLTRESGNLG